MLWAGRTRQWVIGMGGCLVTILYLVVPAPADADLVYGTVREGNQPRGNVTFFVKGRGNRVTTDQRGEYSISLPPGIYTVKFESPVNGTTTIRSLPMPIRQDIDIRVLQR